MDYKSCLTCKNFCRYYIKRTDRACFKPVNNGICLKISLSSKIRKDYFQCNDCEFWEESSAAESEPADKQAIEKQLKKALDIIEDIALYIKST